MPDVDKILKDLLADRRLGSSAVFSSRSYADQPIIQTGKQMREREERNRPSISSLPHTDYSPSTPPAPAEPQADPPRSRPHAKGPRPSSQAAHQTIREQSVPERYYQLRDLVAQQPSASHYSWHGALAYGSRAANRLFYEQALLMEDFEDSFEFHGSFEQYFPTYNSMTLTQLRGYFSWRTRVRAGEMPEAPLSFAFLHVYELLCGIGTSPGEQGYQDLANFYHRYQANSAKEQSTFSYYLKFWLRDYVIYHGLSPELLPKAANSISSNVFTLLRAEEKTLVAQGRARKEPALELDEAQQAVTDEELMAALNECSSYNLCGARFYKSNPDDLRTVACKSFRSLVLHCSRRRKTDFVEGLFGTMSSEFYTMFTSAVFYEPEAHADVTLRLSPFEKFTCTNGMWQRSLLTCASQPNKELGTILHAVDQQLRDRLAYAYPLKQRAVPVYVRKYIDAAIDELLAAKEEAARRSISIDLSQLGHIRAAAAITQEALLTDEERDEQPAASTGKAQEQDCPALAESAAKEQAQEEPAPMHEEPAGSPADAPSKAAPAASAVDTASSSLSPSELAVVQALLRGEAPEAGGQMMSLVIDSINEKLFDLVGDAVIEFDADEPALIEDYEQDVREILGL